MNHAPLASSTYACPRHPDSIKPYAGRCLRCATDLVPAGTRFPMLRHLAGNPWMLATMISLTATATAALVIAIH